MKKGINQGPMKTGINLGSTCGSGWKEKEHGEGVRVIASEGPDLWDLICLFVSTRRVLCFTRGHLDQKNPCLFHKGIKIFCVT
jgi:hypothetical protein